MTSGATPSDDPFHRHEETTIMILKEDLVTVIGSVFRLLQIKTELAALAALDTMTTKEAVSAKSVGRRIGCKDSGRRKPKIGAGERRRSGSVGRKKKCD